MASCASLRAKKRRSRVWQNGVLTAQNVMKPGVRRRMGMVCWRSDRRAMAAAAYGGHRGAVKEEMARRRKWMKAWRRGASGRRCGGDERVTNVATCASVARASRGIFRSFLFAQVSSYQAYIALCAYLRTSTMRSRHGARESAKKNHRTLYCRVCCAEAANHQLSAGVCWRALRLPS